MRHCAWIALLGLLLVGCKKSALTIDDLTKFAPQGPGATSPADMVTAIQTAIEKRDIGALQSLVFADKLTDDERRVFNSQFLTAINEQPATVTFIDDVTVLQTRSLADYAWFVYEPARHDKLINPPAPPPTIAKPADDTKAEPPPEPIDMPTAPENGATASVKGQGVILVEMRPLQASMLANRLEWLIGTPPKQTATYLGVVRVPPAPGSETPANNSQPPQQ